MEKDDAYYVGIIVLIIALVFAILAKVLSPEYAESGIILDSIVKEIFYG